MQYWAKRRIVLRLPSRRADKVRVNLIFKFLQGAYIPYFVHLITCSPKMFVPKIFCYKHNAHSCLFIIYAIGGYIKR